MLGRLGPDPSEAQQEAQCFGGCSNAHVEECVWQSRASSIMSPEAAPFTKVAQPPVLARTRGLPQVVANQNRICVPAACGIEKGHFKFYKSLGCFDTVPCASFKGGEFDHWSTRCADRTPGVGYISFGQRPTSSKHPTLTAHRKSLMQKQHHVRAQELATRDLAEYVQNHAHMFCGCSQRTFVLQSITSAVVRSGFARPRIARPPLPFEGVLALTRSLVAHYKREASCKAKWTQNLWA